jgi:predicted esterase
MKIISLFSMVMGVVMGQQEEFVKVILQPPTEEISRAEVWVGKNTQGVKGVLVICPGVNGDGLGKAQQWHWRELAMKENLGIVGLSFASEVKTIHEKGYYYMSSGSGEMLLKGIEKIYGKPMPLVMYGFSGGAHFVSNFVEQYGKQVICFAAHSAGWWSEPADASVETPGLISCGHLDEERFLPSKKFYNAARRLGRPWLWVGQPKLDHSSPPEYEKFAASYFRSVMKGKMENRVAVRLTTGEVVEKKKWVEHDLDPLYGILPESGFKAEWQRVHKSREEK